MAEPLQVAWQPWATCLIWQSHSRLLLWDTLKSCVTLALVFRILPTCADLAEPLQVVFGRSNKVVLAHALRAHVKGVGLGDPPPRDVLLGTLWSGAVALDNLLICLYFPRYKEFAAWTQLHCRFILVVRESSPRVAAYAAFTFQDPQV